jgi:hypothetical protein
VLPSTYARSPSASGSAASFASHSPRLVRSLAAHTSGHVSRITWQTKLSAPGVLMEEKKRLMKSGASVRPQARQGQHTPIGLQQHTQRVCVPWEARVGPSPAELPGGGSAQKNSRRPTFRSSKRHSAVLNETVSNNSLPPISDI